jgi:DNA-binding transcriptional LysR family regulator
MDRFAALQAFVAVAEARSFSEAARKLRLAKSAISRQISDLEANLGVRLFHRTTRSLSLTDAGRGYFERAERILADLADANRDPIGPGGRIAALSADRGPDVELWRPGI